MDTLRNGASEIEGVLLKNKQGTGERVQSAVNSPPLPDVFTSTLEEEVVNEVVNYAWVVRKQAYSQFSFRLHTVDLDQG